MDSQRKTPRTIEVQIKDKRCVICGTNDGTMRLGTPYGNCICFECASGICYVVEGLEKEMKDGYSIEEAMALCNADMGVFDKKETEE